MLTQVFPDLIERTEPLCGGFIAIAGDPDRKPFAVAFQGPPDAILKAADMVNEYPFRIYLKAAGVRSERQGVLRFAT